MNKDIDFLKELQEELNTQDTDVQAAPRFWVVGDYHMVACPDGDNESYEVHAPNQDFYGDVQDLLQGIKENDLDDMSDEAKDDFSEIECENTATDWLKEYYDEGVYLIPVREEHFIRPNTMFLTKKEAKEHIKQNHYHYSPKAHTYAMTAWRAPKVERLLDILSTFNFKQLEEKKSSNSV